MEEKVRDGALDDKKKNEHNHKDKECTTTILAGKNLKHQKNHDRKQSNNKRKKMLEVHENKRSTIYDQEVVLTNVYLTDQINGEELYKIVRKRKKVPLDALHLWKYDRMRQKDILSEPLIHGMCTVLRNAYMAEFPQDGVIDEQMQKKDKGMEGLPDLNQSPPQQKDMVAVPDLNQSPPQMSPPEQRGMVAVPDLNQSPPQQRGMVALPDLNQSPPQQSPPQHRSMVNEEMQDQKIGMDGVSDQPDEEMQDQKIGMDGVSDQPDEEMQDQKSGLDGVSDQPDEEMQDQKSGLDGVSDQLDEEMQDQKRSMKRGLELTNEERYGAYFALEVIKIRDGGVRPEDKQLIACMLNTSVRTIERIWKTARDQIEKGQRVDVSNQRKGHVGRKKKDLELSRVKSIPLKQRKTIRALARSLGVKRSTLHLRFQCGELKRHTSSLKPLLTEANKIRRLEFILSLLNEESLSYLEPTFQVMDDKVHLDEKWFILERENDTYYLHPEESIPLRTTKNKNWVVKLMFLTALARPRYDKDGKVTFDGKIGIWAFVQEIPAAKKSKNRERGTLELKPLTVDRNVMRKYLCQLVVPAIQDRWPDEDVGRTIYIQQDNAKPHILPNDEAFREAVAQTDLDIRLLQQPPNSPDFNVLDLCFFRSIQSITDTRAPRNIRELIQAVEEEFLNYEVNKLSRSFITLQACMIGAMSVGGGIGYDITHMNKNRLEAEGNLGIALKIPQDLLVKARDILLAAEVQTKKLSAPITKIKKQRSKNKEISISLKKPHSVGAGLRNMGNTCFLNATLQCITHTVPLLKKLLCTDHSSPCSYDEDGFCSFCALKEHAEESILRSGSVLVPARFKDNLSKLSSGFIPGQQEDAHEFLRFLLDNLHKCTLDPNSVEEESIVKQVFGGQLKSQLTCHECGHCSETFESFLDLSLEIDKVDNLVDALKSFTKVEQIGDVENKITCHSCNSQVCKDKRLLIDKAPDVVAFQLKRFTTLEKIEKRVSYPLELDLKLFHSNPEKEDVKYDLYGVVEHSGLRNYGHYVCAIRSSPSTWHLMNDSDVGSISETRALGQEAYILFYVRQGMFPWFSTIQEKATRPKRICSANDHNVFAFENLDEEDTKLMHVTEHQTKAKKQKAASCLDQNVSRLLKGMPSARRKGFLDCIVTQRNEQESRSGNFNLGVVV